MKPVQFRISEPEGEAIDRVAKGLSRNEFARRATLAAAVPSKPAPPPVSTPTRADLTVEYDTET